MEIVLNPKFVRRGRKATQICAAIVYENFVEAMKPIRQFWFSVAAPRTEEVYG